MDAYFLESVDIHTNSGYFVFFADLIRYVNNGSPLNNLMFLSGIDFEPDLATTNQRIF